MRYWLDTEFDEKKLFQSASSNLEMMTIDLISIGIVAEDGRELYLQSSRFSPQIVSDWVRDNVLPHLSLCPHAKYYSEHTVFGDHIYHFERGQCTFEEKAKGITGFSGVKMPDAYLIGAHADCYWRTKEQIKNELVAFMDTEKYGYPELVGWCSAYDFVVFCQLWGTMMDVPRFIPHYMQDIQSLLDKESITDDMLPEQEGQAHNALADALQIKKILERLQK